MKDRFGNDVLVMAAASPSDRSQIARMGAYAQHKQNDVKETTKAANAGFKAKFLREADPEGTLSEAERERRAEAAFKEHMTRLGYRSGQARRKRKATKLDIRSTGSGTGGEPSSAASKAHTHCWDSASRPT